MNSTSEKENRIFKYLSKVDITSKLLNLVEEEFTGKIIFGVNFYNGGITNINVSLDKSIKL